MTLKKHETACTVSQTVNKLDPKVNNSLKSSISIRDNPISFREKILFFWRKRKMINGH